MDFLGHVKRINSAVLAGRSFAAYHRTNFRSGAAGCQAGFGDIAAKVLDFIIRNSLTLYREPGCHGHDSISITLCGFRDTDTLIRGDFSIYSNNAGGKAICTLVSEKAQGFYSFFLTCSNCHVDSPSVFLLISQQYRSLFADLLEF